MAFSVAALILNLNVNAANAAFDFIIYKRQIITLLKTANVGNTAILSFFF